MTSHKLASSILLWCWFTHMVFSMHSLNTGIAPQFKSAWTNSRVRQRQSCARFVLAGSDVKLPQRITRNLSYVALTCWAFRRRCDRNIRSPRVNHRIKVIMFNEKFVLDAWWNAWLRRDLRLQNTKLTRSGIWNYESLKGLDRHPNEEPISFQVPCEKGPNEEPDRHPNQLSQSLCEHAHNMSKSLRKITLSYQEQYTTRYVAIVVIKLCRGHTYTYSCPVRATHGSLYLYRCDHARH